MSSPESSGGKITPLQQMLSSGSGALITSFLGHSSSVQNWRYLIHGKEDLRPRLLPWQQHMTPLDVVKTRLQAQLKPIPKPPCYLFCNGLMDHLCLCTNVGSPFRPFPHVPHPPFNSTVDALIKIPRYEGMSALWRGLPPTLVMAVPNTMIYFTLYDQLKVMYGFMEGQENIWSPMCAGITARTISITCISPIEMIRTKMQAKKGFSYKELVSIIRSAIQQGGLLSLWQGLGPTLLRDVPFSAVYWTGYEILKSKFADPGFAASFSSGAVSGAMAALLTTPFDVIKTHRQMELGELVFRNPSAVKKLPFTFSLMFQLYRESGWRSLFAGVSARVMKVAPACAIMISTYELSKYFFRKYNMENFTSVTARTSR